MAMDKNISREVYYKFLNSSLTWLLRQEFRKPLILQNFELQASSDASSSFGLIVTGAAASYLGESNSWQLSVCGEEIPLG